jgi:hypothetical protein
MLRQQKCSRTHGQEAGLQGGGCAGPYSPIQAVDGKVPPVVSVVVPTGQAVQLTAGTVVLPPLENVPMGQAVQLPGATGSTLIPRPAAQMGTAGAQEEAESGPGFGCAAWPLQDPGDCLGLSVTQDEVRVH